MPATKSPKSPKPVHYATPADAEQAFYQAIEARDLDALMSAWADDEEIVCIHPNGQRTVGHTAIRASWQAVLEGDRKLEVELVRAVRWTGMLMSVHSVIEQITIDGGGAEASMLTLAASNVFIRGANGWRLLSHHSSAIQEQDSSEPEPARQHTLH